MAPRKIVDAKADAKGNISHVKLQDNVNFTPIKTAVRMADRGREGARRAHIRRQSASQNEPKRPRRR